MNDIEKLREHLFATLDGLKDKSIGVEVAKLINETAQTIVNTAKVECDFIKASGRVVKSDFFAALPALPEPVRPEQTATGTKQITQFPGGSITAHRMR